MGWVCRLARDSSCRASRATPLHDLPQVVHTLLGRTGVGLGVRVASVSLLAWRMKMMSGETMKHTAPKCPIGDRSRPTLTIGTTVSETLPIFLFLFYCSFYGKLLDLVSGYEKMQFLKTPSSAGARQPIHSAPTSTLPEHESVIA